MKIQLIYLLFSIGVIVVAFSTNACKEKSNASTTTRRNSKPEPTVNLKPAPEFNADSAYTFVERQVAFGHRVPNTEAHRQAGNYLVQRLKDFGWQVQTQAFQATAWDGSILDSRNIIGSFNPKVRKRILLAAHWDSRAYNDKEAEIDSSNYEPIDGANDGASGVGVLLEIARVIEEAEQKPGVGIDIIFFDSEDQGQPEGSRRGGNTNTWCLGSQHWAENPHLPSYSAYYGILLDMVGAKGAQFYQEEYSRKYAPTINDQVWKIGQKLGYTDFFISKHSPGIIDDHVFVNEKANIPMIDIIQYDPSRPGHFFAPYHHTLSDNMEIIDRTTLKAVGQTVLQTLYNEENEEVQ